jgi:hypothetical protein
MGSTRRAPRRPACRRARRGVAGLVVPCCVSVAAMRVRDVVVYDVCISQVMIFIGYSMGVVMAVQSSV